MLWKIVFHCEPIYALHLSNALEEYTLATSTFETKDPDIWAVEAITSKEPDREAFQSILSAACALLETSTPNLIIEPLPETDWLEATWRNFPPRQIGRYYVYGSHTSPNPPSGSVTLEINAATAFGSGEHETTTGCLLTLDELATQGRRFHKPLDMGCGSGILAIAIAKTWGASVVAADNDPESVKVTTTNAALNQCPSLVTAYLSSGFDNPDVRAQGPFDLIVANILAAPLIKMAPALSQALALKGLAILSGLLSRHKADVVQAYEAAGFRLASHRTLNGWEALGLEKVGKLI